MDVNPNPEALLVGKSAVGDFDRDVPVLLTAAIHERSRVRPPTIPINNAELARHVWMGFYEQGLEQAFVGLNLALKFFVFFWAEAGLVRMGDYLIDIDFRPVSPEDSAI